METSHLKQAGSWKRNAALFLGGQSLSMFGSMLVHYAITWHVTLKTQSGSVMTLFAIAGVLPMFFLSPFGGVWADRYNRKYLINISDAVIAAVTLVMALLFFAGFDNIGLLFICAVVRAAGQGVQTPAVNAIIPEIVPEEHLTKINGINSTVQSLCMFAAPMASGALLAFAPIEGILFIDAVTAAIGISLVFFFVRVPPRQRSEAAASAVDYFRDIKEGLLYVAKYPFIRRFLLISALFCIMAAPMVMLTPIQVTRNFGTDIWMLTAIELAFSIGMMLGGVVIGFWGGFKNKAYTMTLANVVFGAVSIALGLVGNFWVYLACMLVCGFSMPMFNTPVTTIFQSKVDADYMGRVFSVMTMISSVMMPLGMVIFGPLGDIISIDYILIGTGAVIFLSSFLIAGSKAIREAGAAN
ncbi:MAG: MFS transporter [Clostridiales bacterium]|nr:MFS transporter [Clostridiales bacterium]